VAFIVDDDWFHKAIYFILHTFFYMNIFFPFSLLQHGMSALHFAANAGHLEILNLLLAAGADVNAVDEVR